MIHKLPLSGSQHQGWDLFEEEKAKAQCRERRFLNDCLVELGGRLNEPWKFDELTRTFYINIPDEKEPNAAADSGAATPLDQNVAG